MTRGTAAGLLTTLGVTLGLGMFASLSLLGLAAVLAEYRWLAWTVRVLGGGYLIYLGIRLFLTSRGKTEEIVIQETAESGRPRGNPLVFGFLVTLTNPKAIVLFASVFAPAVSTGTPLWIMALMVALVMASSLVWYAIVSLFMSSAPVMRRFSDAQHWIERLAGVCFVGIGGRILADARNPVTP